MTEMMVAAPTGSGAEGTQPGLCCHLLSEVIQEQGFAGETEAWKHPQIHTGRESSPPLTWGPRQGWDWAWPVCPRWAQAPAPAPGESTVGPKPGSEE